MATPKSKFILYSLTFAALATNGLQAAVITGSISVSCPANGSGDSSTLNSQGSTSVSCSAGFPTPQSADATISADPFSAFMQLNVQSASGSIVTSSGTLSVRSTLVLTGGSGAASILPFQAIPAADPTTNCTLSLNGTSLSCFGPLDVEFGVPFLVEFGLSATETGGAAHPAYRQWRLTTTNGSGAGASFQQNPYGVFQNGLPFSGASLTEVSAAAVPEPATGLLLTGTLLGGYLLRLRRRR